MVIKPKSLKRELLDEFRSDRGQTEQLNKESVAIPPSRKRRNLTPYDTFFKKYLDFGNCVEKFGTRDLVYYFREVSNRNGYKYTISNIKKDMAIMKRLRDNYSNTEICAMIEFLYESGQDYLQKDRLSPNVLASSWVNTIYADTQLWVDDKYIPNSEKKKKKTREWVKNNSSENDENVNIGVKL